MQPTFILNQTCEFIFLHLLALAEGLMVSRLGVKVNYTRKLNHFFVFFSPYLFRVFIPFEETTATLILMPVVSLASLAIYLKPVRSRLRIVRLMFMAFDRPEDRPHTLRWLFTQYLATYLVALPLYFYFSAEGYPFIIPILVLINGIGDGLAEPVGVRFGRHTYATRALFSERKYTRSLEGSACVFLASVLALCLYASGFSSVQLALGILLLPIIMTLAEAFSPHTWDSPFLFLAGGVTMMGVMAI